MSSQRIRIPLLFILLLSACAPAVTGGTPAAPDVPAIPAASAPPVGSLSGWVLDLEGNPLAGAEVLSITGSTLSAADGSFSLPGAGRAGWVQVSLTGYIGRTRAVAPDAPAVFRLSPDDGRTIVIHFVGDTMFGRRFFDPNEDGDPSDGLLPTQPTTAEQVALLDQIEPLLSAADLRACQPGSG